MRKRARDRHAETPLRKRARDRHAETPLRKRARDRHAETPLRKRARDRHSETPLRKRARERHAETPLRKRARDRYVETPLRKRARDRYVETPLRKRARDRHAQTPRQREQDKGGERKREVPSSPRLFHSSVEPGSNLELTELPQAPVPLAHPPQPFQRDHEWGDLRTPCPRHRGLDPPTLSPSGGPLSTCVHSWLPRITFFKWQSVGN